MAYRRPAAPAPPLWNAVKSLVAVAVFWLAALVAVPWAIVATQHRVQTVNTFLPTAPELAVVCFGISALVMLWAALTVAVAGAGTPLPFDAPRRLVVSGPYAWCRNPMMLATVGLGTADLLYTGSVPVLLYVVLLAWLWHVTVRPEDERNLQRLFGREYEAYQRGVRLWMPMRRPWLPPPAGRPPISLEDLPTGWEHRRRVRD